MTHGTGPLCTLGLLGGMGPAATMDVLDKIIKSTPASRDQEHIPVLVRWIPQIPDRTDALLGRGPSPANALTQGAIALRRAGADVLAIACNTAHHWYEVIREASGLPVVHIAEAVATELREGAAAGPVGIMATSGTVLSGFYRQYLEAAGCRVIEPLPESQKYEVDRAIACVKAGDWTAARWPAQNAAEALFGRGAKRVVMACTELPLALGRVPGRHLLDANLALARACVRAVSSGGQEKAPQWVA